MATKKIPVDPVAGGRCILQGRIVTMNAQFKVIDAGRIYLADGLINAVRSATASPPRGFESAPIIDTGGTIYPGLIELHNHLSYDALQLWQVPRIFAHRGQWSNHPDKKRLISQPMSVLASIGGMIEALVRYVEAKCLVAGVTTSQGLTLVAAPGIEHRYRGIVRNVENTDDPSLPEALTRIADVTSAADFAKRLQKAKGSLLLHLAEGIGEAARKHFLRLELGSNRWAITDALIGIHAAALLADDFAVLADHEAGIVWSPLSNLLLYGGTANVKQAKETGVLIALGSDWSPSGSKNLLSELKVAWAWSEREGGVFKPRELVAMATINPARMLKWDSALGSIEVGKRADFVVFKGKSGDPYEKILKALEDDIRLVMINGVPRFGTNTLIARACERLGLESSQLEARTIAGQTMKLNFAQETADPLVAPVTLATAEARLSDGLRDLPELASALTDPVFASANLGIFGGTGPVAQRWTLELDNEMDHGGTGTLRALAPPELEPESSPFGGEALAANASSAANLVSMKLDALTVADDSDYFERLNAQINLPAGFAAEVAKLHGVRITPTSGARVSLPPVADAPFQIEHSLPRSLSELRQLPDTLTRADRVALVKRLYQLLSELYVHLPLKRASHAVDPLQRLRLLQYALEETNGATELSGLAFHERVLEIFTELRDLHTTYILPPPYSDLTAFLPFLLERCYDLDRTTKQQRAVYIVSKVAQSLEHPTFLPGVEILYWNGMPIENAILANADRQAGSNMSARFARGLAGMTIRPLARVLPPLEEWVLMTYRALDGRTLEIRLPWQMRSSSSTMSFDLPPLSARAVHAAAHPSRGMRARARGAASLGSIASFGVDVQMEAVNTVRRDLYAKARPRGRVTIAARGEAKELRTRFSNVLRARTVKVGRKSIGHLRIFTFSVPDADAFVAEIVRLVKQMPKSGLIVDVRGNGGGLIWAAEQLLQLFTDARIEPERAQFLSSPATLRLVRLNSPSPHSSTLNLAPWIDSIARAVVTAAVHSEGFPITPIDKANAIGRQYHGPVVLVTDALAYSATDMFAAGFRDHAIGPILGVDDNTGAGGANVWSYSLLQTLLSEDGDDWSDLPGGCDVRVAIRRTLGVGPNAGMPLEDLGVVPDERHHLTRRDVLEDNQDLIAHAAELLAR